jgi:hypothetical protein
MVAAEPARASTAPARSCYSGRRNQERCSGRTTRSPIRSGQHRRRGFASACPQFQQQRGSRSGWRRAPPPRPEQEFGNRAPRRSPPRRRSSTRLMGLERSARPSCVWNGQRRRHAASRITSACSSSSTFRTTSSIVILSGPATRRLLSSTPWNEPTIIGAASAGTTFRPTSTYTTLRDVTRRRPDPAVERRWSGGGRESIGAHTGA